MVKAIVKRNLSSSHLFYDPELAKPKPYEKVTNETDYPLELTDDNIEEFIPLTTSKFICRPYDDPDLHIVDIEARTEDIFRLDKVTNFIFKISEHEILRINDKFHSKMVQLWDIRSQQILREGFIPDTFTAGLNKDTLLCYTILTNQLVFIGLNDFAVKKFLDLPKTISLQPEKFLAAKNNKFIANYYNEYAADEFGAVIIDANYQITKLPVGQGSFCLLPENKLAMIGEGKLRIWDLETYNLEKTIEDQYTKHLFDMKIIPLDHNCVAAAGDVLDGNCYIWNYQTGQIINIIPHPDDSIILDIAFSEDSALTGFIAHGDFGGGRATYSMHTWYFEKPEKELEPDLERDWVLVPGK